MSARYVFEYWQLWDTVARQVERPKNRSSELCRMHKWLAQTSPWQEAELAYPTTNHPFSSCCIFGNCPSLQGTQVQNRGVPEMGDGPTRLVYIRKYPYSIMCQRYVNNLQSNYHCQAWNPVERGAFAGHLLKGMIRFWSCPVHASDVDLFTFSFGG